MPDECNRQWQNHEKLNSGLKELQAGTREMSRVVCRKILSSNIKVAMQWRKWGMAANAHQRRPAGNRSIELKRKANGEARET